ncbi:MAG: PqqD family protein [Bacteroidales bacterium]|nr:PqqD family protein [Bacteroidales bacterium]
MKIDNTYKVRQVAGESLVLVQPRQGEEMTKVVALNETSVFLWDSLVDKDFVVDDAVALLLERYDVDRETATRDVERWVELMRGAGIIVD